MKDDLIILHPFLVEFIAAEGAFPVKQDMLQCDKGYWTTEDVDFV